MEQPRFYEIRVEGQITDDWCEWFDGLAIRTTPDGDTVLSGVIGDQAALFGTLNKILGLNLILVSIQRADRNPLQDSLEK